jgi:hypothetical protein
MSFFLFKKKPSLSFVFDIRDSFISSGIVRFQDDKKPELILCEDFDILYQNKKDHRKYVASMIRTLDRAVISMRKELVKMGIKENIDKHYFFIGSPWSVSQSKTIKILKNKLFEVNSELLNKIIISEEFAVEKEIEDITSEPNWKVLEQKIIQSKINGYKIENIFGKKTSNLSLELFVSFIPYEIKDKLSSYINERLGKKNKDTKHSCILSSYSFLRDLYSDRNDFIYVDIGGLITDIYVVRDDIVFNIGSFPFGEGNIIETAMERSNLSRTILMSHLNIGRDKKFDLDSHNNGVDLLRHGFSIWRNNLETMLSKMCTEMNIPNNIFAISNSLVTDILFNELDRESESNSLNILGTNIRINNIKESILNNFISNGKSFPNKPYIKMDMVFIDKMQKNN